jgi:hypothetical protein
MTGRMVSGARHPAGLFVDNPFVSTCHHQLKPRDCIPWVLVPRECNP